MAESPASLTSDVRACLGRLAWESLVAAVRGGRQPVPPTAPPELVRPGATFVSLHAADGELRGCIGTIEPCRQLAVDVVENARAAALEDARFSPLTPRELAGLRLEIAVLSPLEPLPARSRDELCRRLRPGVDGLVLADGGRRATFLPVVWEQLPEPRRFLFQLELKAGLDAGGWRASRRAWRYTVESFAAPGPDLSA